MPDLQLPDDVLTLARARTDDAMAVLAHAFASDPLLRYVFDDWGDAYAGALRALFRFSCAVRFELDWPLLGAERAGRLVGVMDVNEPADRAWPPALSAAHAQRAVGGGRRAADGRGRGRVETIGLLGHPFGVEEAAEPTFGSAPPLVTWGVPPAWCGLTSA